ncbi:dTDP-4-dehydrorhamnose 3,5-epimerase [Niveispirillum fermenti]|uniref:dTDP-4-dehydrorhamnose 3,5-epimerase n=1 Tax=Niveispirillum fermenti TaxID=1233113 RepID=UPI003A898C59
MQVTRFDIQGPVLLTPARFGDHRGFFSETYSRRRFAEATGEDVEFVQDNHSLSRDAGTLRGLHFQRHPTAQGKLVRVVRGALLDVAVDLRHGSATFGRHVRAELTADNGAQLWVPVGFAHGFCTLVPDTEVVYKVTSYYSPADDGGVIWNDADIGIEWPFPADKLVLSDKDTRLPRLADLPPLF